MSDAVENAIENVAEVASEVVAAAEITAENAIEHAAEQIEAAEEIADQVMEAAMLTELGRQVRECLERAETWHAELNQRVETQASEILSLQNQVAELTTQLAAQQPQVIVATPETDQTSSIPLASEAVETMEAAIVTPAQAVVPSVPTSDVQPARRKMRLI